MPQGLARLRLHGNAREMKAALHSREDERLRALRSYDILDTPREASFDDIADLAARLCDAPIAVVNLIDAERQWFKAEVGLGVRELPLDDSICAHAILVGDYMEVPDTLQDVRMRDNPLCLAEGGLRFYAGAVLLARGCPIGTLCVLDTVPRVLDDLQRHALRILAAQVMTQLDLRITLRREALLRKEIDHRVKNSLHSVAAFARLQRRAVASADAVESIAAIEQQIDTVALLHDLLSHDDEQKRVDLGVYLDRLTGLIARAAPSLAVTGSFDRVRVEAATAGTVGAIVNELVANAVKHSFPEGAGGSIRLSGQALGDRYRIVCADDGPGCAVVPDDAGRARLGMRIIAASLTQIGGTIEGGRVDGGYRSTVEFAPGASAVRTG